MSAKVSTFSRGIKAAGTTVENEPIIKSDGAGEVFQWQPSDGAADGIFITENTAGDPLRMGIGVTPAATVADYTALEMGGLTNISAKVGAGVAGNPTVISNNAFITANNFNTGWKRLIEDECSQHLLVDGTHKFRVAGSAATSAAITWIDALTVSNTGVVTIPGNVAFVSGSGSGTTQGRVQIGSTTSSDNNSLVFNRGAAPTIDANHAAIFCESSGGDAGESLTLMGDAIRFANEGGTTQMLISSAGLTTVSSITETNGVLRSNLLSNSGFDVWSNSTLEDVGSELVTTFTNQNFNTVPGSSAWNGAFVNNAASWGVGQQAVSLTAGKLYKLSFDGSSVSGVPVTFGTASNTGGSDLKGVTVTAASGISYVFEASATTTYIMLHTSSADAAGFTLANVSLKEVTPKCIATDDKAPDGWAKSSTLDLSRISHNTTNIKGMYGCHLLTGSTGAEEVYQPSASAARGEQSWYNKFRGRTVTFGCWLYADSTASNGARAYIRDQDGSSFATQVAADTLTWVEVTRTISATAWSSTAQYVQLGVKYECGSAAKNCYVSQPMLVYGSAIGAGNYSRPSGEVINCEKSIRIQDNVSPAASDDKVLNLEALSSGKIPKGCKAVNLDSYVINSSVTSGHGILWHGGDATVWSLHRNYPTVNNLASVQQGTVPADSNGDIHQVVTEADATLSGLYLDVSRIELR